MEIAFEVKGRALTVKLRGEIDQHCARELRSAIDGRLHENREVKRLVFDLERVSFMDSSGIGVILGRYRFMRDRGGETAIVNAQKNVEKLLRLSGVYGLTESAGRSRANG